MGTITHYFDKIGVAVVKVEAPFSVGDKISIEGNNVKFEQTVESMQIDKDKVEKAEKGTEIGMKVAQEVKKNYVVYKV